MSPAVAGPDRPPRRASDRDRAAMARRYADALRAVDGARAEQVADEALARGVSAVEIGALIIEPAMVQIGERWQSEALTIAHEHLATAISERIVARLSVALVVAPPRSRERVLLAAIQGQQHVLGLRMVASVLEGAGFDVLFLGPDVPADALRQFVAEQQPAVVGLSATVTDQDDRLDAAVAAVRDASSQPRLMLGGQAIPPALRDGEYAFVRSVLDVLPCTERLLSAAPAGAHGRAR